MFVSPGLAIVKRELLSGFRDKRPYFFLALMLFVMIITAVYVMYTITMHSTLAGGRFYGPEPARLFFLYVMALYCGAVLFIPAMAAVSVCVERQQNSLELLQMTHIRPSTIIAAKFLNVLGLYGLVLIATLPLAGVFFFFVGIDWYTFAKMLVIIGFSAVSCAAIGVFCSTWFHRTIPAVVTTFGICLLLQGGMVFLAILFVEALGRQSWLYKGLRALNEDILLAFAPAVFMVYQPGIGVSTQTIATNAFIFGVISLLALWFAVVLVSRPERSNLGVDSRFSRIMSLPFRLAQPVLSVLPRPRLRYFDLINPVLQKELKTGLFARAAYPMAFFVAYLGFCLLVSWNYAKNRGMHVPDYGSFVASALLLDASLLLLVAPALVATAFAKEHELGNWDLLHTTLLRPRDILRGKVGAAFLAASVPIAAAAVGAYPMVRAFDSNTYAWSGFASGMGTMIVSVLYVISLTLLVTVGCRRSLLALMQGYAASALAIVVIAGTIFFNILIGSRFSSVEDDTERLVGFISPMVAQAVNIKEANDGPNDTWMLTRYWMGNVVCFLLISAFLLWLAKLRFARLHRGALSHA